MNEEGEFAKFIQDNRDVMSTAVKLALIDLLDQGSVKSPSDASPCKKSSDTKKHTTEFSVVIVKHTLSDFSLRCKLALSS